MAVSWWVTELGPQYSTCVCWSKIDFSNIKINVHICAISHYIILKTFFKYICSVKQTLDNITCNMKFHQDCYWTLAKTVIDVNETWIVGIERSFQNIGMRLDHPCCSLQTFDTVERQRGTTFDNSFNLGKELQKSEKCDHSIPQVAFRYMLGQEEMATSLNLHVFSLCLMRKKNCHRDSQTTY